LTRHAPLWLPAWMRPKRPRPVPGGPHCPQRARGESPPLPRTPPARRQRPGWWQRDAPPAAIPALPGTALDGPDTRLRSHANGAGPERCPGPCTQEATQAKQVKQVVVKEGCSKAEEQQSRDAGGTQNQAAHKQASSNRQAGKQQQTSRQTVTGKPASRHQGKETACQIRFEKHSA
jgi:hypothetical protein